MGYELKGIRYQSRTYENEAVQVMEVLKERLDNDFLGFTFSMCRHGSKYRLGVRTSSALCEGTRT